MALLIFKTWDLCSSVLYLQPFLSDLSRHLQQDDINVFFHHNSTLFLLSIYPKVAELQPVKQLAGKYIMQIVLFHQLTLGFKGAVLSFAFLAAVLVCAGPFISQCMLNITYQTAARQKLDSGQCLPYLSLLITFWKDRSNLSQLWKHFLQSCTRSVHAWHVQNDIWGRRCFISLQLCITGLVTVGRCLCWLTTIN